MHPLVRDLYKRVLLVGREYPTGLEHVKAIWKPALQRPLETAKSNQVVTEKDIRLAVGRGRSMVQEMVGVIQLKKYRTLRQRYNNNQDNIDQNGGIRSEQQQQQQQQQEQQPMLTMEEAMERLETEANRMTLQQQQQHNYYQLRHF